MVNFSAETHPKSDPIVQSLAPGAPPNSELFADVERDLTRVEQSLAELTDPNTDPEGVVTWLGSSTSTLDNAELDETVPPTEVAGSGDVTAAEILPTDS